MYVFGTILLLIYLSIYLSIYIRESYYNLKLESNFASCLNLCEDHIIIIHLSFLIFVLNELMSAKYYESNINEL